MATARAYLYGSIGVALLVLLYYWQYAAHALEPPSGRTPEGVALGILGFAAMLGALLYSARRRFLARAMNRIRVDPATRKVVREREDEAFKQLQNLRDRVLGRQLSDPQEIRREAKKILKDNQVARHICVRLSGERGQPLHLAIERREWAGRLEIWYYWHLMLGSLSILLILTHAGFRFGNLVATLAFVCLVGVVITGVIGYLIYCIVPPALTKVEDRVKKTPEELRLELEEINAELAKLAEKKSSYFREIYQREIAIPRVSLQPSFPWLWGPASIERDLDRPTRLKMAVTKIPESEQADFYKMTNFIHDKEKLEVSLYPQLRYEYLLKIWLAWHIPLTAGLMIFSLIHIVSIWYY